MIITGNPTKGLAQSLLKLYPDALFCSRVNGYNLVETEGMEKFAKDAVEHDTIVLNSALWRFHQTVLLDIVYQAQRKVNKSAHIVCVGSTTDRTNKGSTWLYNAEKKALRDYSNSLALVGVWHSGPKISYISFGTLSNNQHKHPDRTCININTAAEYIKWIIDQPLTLAINELSIDPIQEKT
jgi:NADP-dependent 3-hydroxy acid dehydrogenase YdfG